MIAAWPPLAFWIWFSVGGIVPVLAAAAFVLAVRYFSHPDD